MGGCQAFSIPVWCAGSKQLATVWGLGWVGGKTGMEMGKGGEGLEGGREIGREEAAWPMLYRC